MNATTLFLGVIFSSIGLGYFIYGKRQQMNVPLFSGIILMIYPYFINNITLLSIIGVILILIPWFWRA